MNQQFTAWLQKHKISSWQALAIAAGLLGLLLVCISSFWQSKPKASAAGTSAALQPFDLTAYEQNLEQRIQGFVSQVAGAGEATVLLTLESGTEPVYATQGDSKQESRQGATQQEEQFSASKEYVLVGSGANETGLVLKLLEPQVRGVAVVCQGGNDLQVRQAITEAVSRVLGIGAHKVSVAQRSSP